MEKLARNDQIMIARKRRAVTIHSRYPIGIYGSIVMTDIAQLLGKDADNLYSTVV